MATGGYDEVAKRYGFKTVNVARWRDPNASIHTARGGPSGPKIPGDPYKSPYKFTYRIPTPPSDDEESEDEDEDDTDDEDERQPEPAPEPVLVDVDSREYLFRL
jgi:hypothetical protein